MDEKKWARRWALYRRELKGFGIGCLIAWRNVPPHARDAWRGVRDFAASLLPLALCIIGPVLAPLSPLLAVLGVLSIERQAAKDAAARDRRRGYRSARAEPDEHETHCGCSDCM
jgi:hypothetical protein